MTLLSALGGTVLGTGSQQFHCHRRLAQVISRANNRLTFPRLRVSLGTNVIATTHREGNSLGVIQLVSCEPGTPKTIISPA
jgi:hypothetical protein